MHGLRRNEHRAEAREHSPPLRSSRQAGTTEQPRTKDEPPAPIETICDDKNGGSYGSTGPPNSCSVKVEGIPSADDGVLNPAAPPVPALYEITLLATCPRANGAVKSANTAHFTKHFRIPIPLSFSNVNLRDQLRGEGRKNQKAFTSTKRENEGIPRAPAKTDDRAGLILLFVGEASRAKRARNRRAQSDRYPDFRASNLAPAFPVASFEAAQWQ